MVRDLVCKWNRFSYVAIGKLAQKLGKVQGNEELSRLGRSFQSSQVLKAVEVYSNNGYFLAVTPHRYRMNRLYVENIINAVEE